MYSCLKTSTTRSRQLKNSRSKFTVLYAVGVLLFLVGISTCYAFTIPPTTARRLVHSSSLSTSTVKRCASSTTPSQQKSTTTASPSSSSSSSPSSNKDADDSRIVSSLSSNKKKTLYDVLGAQPSDSRAELKKHYVRLARKCHPDARRGSIADHSNNTTKATDDTEVLPDFTEVAAAWRILSDAKQRKRYDRALQAEEFSENVLHWMGQVAKEAAPVAEQFGNAMSSFLRRTTATTLAGVQAAATEVRRKRSDTNTSAANSNGAAAGAAESKNIVSEQDKSSTQQTKPSPVVVAANASLLKNKVSEQDKSSTQPTKPSPVVDAANASLLELSTNVTLETTRATTAETTKSAKEQRPNSNAISQALKSAVQAAQLVNRKMDSMELFEKSQAVEMQALIESAQAQKTKKELQDIVERRLEMALHTPGSGLTAAEALVILEDFNKTISDDLTPWDRAMLRHTIEYEIQELQKVEAAFVTAQKADSEAQAVYQACMQANFQAKQGLVAAEKEEIRAREAYESSKLKVIQCKNDLMASARELAHSEVMAKKSDWEMEVRSLALEKQSEKVRTALRDKEKAVYKERGLGTPVPDAQGNANREHLEELNRLRQQEQFMAQTSQRLEFMAERLFERARGLRKRAQELD